MNIRMQLALVPDMPAEEALECAEEDWKDDAHGKPVMNREQFFHALFQLADLWVDSVHEQDYVRCGYPRIWWRIGVVLRKPVLLCPCCVSCLVRSLSLGFSSSLRAGF